MPNTVWPSNNIEVCFSPTSTLPPSMHQKPTEHGYVANQPAPYQKSCWVSICHYFLSYLLLYLIGIILENMGSWKIFIGRAQPNGISCRICGMLIWILTTSRFHSVIQFNKLTLCDWYSSCLKFVLWLWKLACNWEVYAHGDGNLWKYIKSNCQMVEVDCICKCFDLFIYVLSRVSNQLAFLLEFVRVLSSHSPCRYTPNDFNKVNAI